MYRKWESNLVRAQKLPYLSASLVKWPIFQIPCHMFPQMFSFCSCSLLALVDYGLFKRRCNTMKQLSYRRMQPWRRDFRLKYCLWSNKIVAQKRQYDKTISDYRTGILIFRNASDREFPSCILLILNASWNYANCTSHLSWLLILYVIGQNWISDPWKRQIINRITLER